MSDPVFSTRRLPIYNKYSSHSQPLDPGGPAAAKWLFPPHLAPQCAASQDAPLDPFAFSGNNQSSIDRPSATSLSHRSSSQFAPTGPAHPPPFIYSDNESYSSLASTADSLPEIFQNLSVGQQMQAAPASNFRRPGGTVVRHNVMLESGTSSTSSTSSFNSMASSTTQQGRGRHIEIHTRNTQNLTPNLSAAYLHTPSSSPSKRHQLVSRMSDMTTRIKDKLSSSLFKSPSVSSSSLPYFSQHGPLPVDECFESPAFSESTRVPQFLDTNRNGAEMTKDIQIKLQQSFPYRNSDLKGIEDENKFGVQKPSTKLKNGNNEGANSFQYTDNPTHTSYVANRGSSSSRRAFSLVRNSKLSPGLDVCPPTMPVWEHLPRDSGTHSTSTAAYPTGIYNNQFTDNDQLSFTSSNTSLASSNSSLRAMRHDSMDGLELASGNSYPMVDRSTRRGLHRLQSLRGIRNKNGGDAGNVVDWCVKMTPNEYYYPTVDQGTKNMFFGRKGVKNNGSNSNTNNSDSQYPDSAATDESSGYTTDRPIIDGVKGMFRTGTSYMKRMRSQKHQRDVDNKAGHDGSYYDDAFFGQRNRGGPVEIYQDPGEDGKRVYRNKNRLKRTSVEGSESDTEVPSSAGSTATLENERRNFGASVSMPNLTSAGTVYQATALSRGGSRHTVRSVRSVRSARSMYSNATTSSSKSSAGGRGTLSQRTVLRSRVNGNSVKELERLQRLIEAEREMEQERNRKRQLESKSQECLRVGDEENFGEQQLKKKRPCSQVRQEVKNLSNDSDESRKRRGQSTARQMMKKKKKKKRMPLFNQASSGIYPGRGNESAVSLASCSPATTKFIFDDMQDVYSMMMADELSFGDD